VISGVYAPRVKVVMAMLRHRFFRTLSAGIVLAGLALASAHAESVIRIGLQDDADSFDPARAYSFVGRIILTSLCNKLVDTAPDLTFVPLLIMAFWIGLYPKPFFQILEQPVNQIIQSVNNPPAGRAVNAAVQPSEQSPQPAADTPPATTPSTGRRY